MPLLRLFGIFGMQRITRVVLSIAIFITAYLLLMAWQKDYGNNDLQSKAEQSAQLTPANSSNALEATPSSLVNGDIPKAAPITANIPALEQSASITPSTENAANFIHVKTDIYDLTIDLKGGDIVRLNLLGHKQNNQTEVPFTLLQNDSNRVYIAQSGLIGTNGPDASTTGRPVYKSSKTEYTFDAGQAVLTIPLTYIDSNNTMYTKKFEFKAGKYPITISYVIENNSSQPWVGQLFGRLKRDSATDPSTSSQGVMSVGTFLGGAWGVPTAQYNKINFSDFAGDKVVSDAEKGGYIAMVQHYFVSSWIPDATMPTMFKTSILNGNHLIEFYSKNLQIEPGKSLTVNSTFYAGPKVQSILAPLAKGLDKTIDYGVLWPIAKPLFWGLNKIHDNVGNWGWAIILLTVVVKIILWPLASTSYRSMAKMKLIAPQMQKMKEEFGADRARFAQEMMAMYKREKVSPLAGCLPMLLQMPIFMALYWVFMESVELRHAPWIGWIHDLSSMDKWFVLPLIMGVTMYIQQQLNPQPTDPMQAKMMQIMPIAFTVFMLWFPAGLVLYWCVNNILTIAQQWYINQDVKKHA